MTAAVPRVPKPTSAPPARPAKLSTRAQRNAQTARRTVKHVMPPTTQCAQHVLTTLSTMTAVHANVRRVYFQASPILFFWIKLFKKEDLKTNQILKHLAFNQLFNVLFTGFGTRIIFHVWFVLLSMTFVYFMICLPYNVFDMWFVFVSMWSSFDTWSVLDT